jgi:hypothetical protein
MKLLSHRARERKSGCWFLQFKLFSSPLFVKEISFPSLGTQILMKSSEREKARERARGKKGLAVHETETEGVLM